MNENTMNRQISKGKTLLSEAPRLNFKISEYIVLTNELKELAENNREPDTFDFVLADRMYALGLARGYQRAKNETRQRKDKRQ